jgi:hypothetical protein
MKKLILCLSTVLCSLTLLAAAPADEINAKVLAAFEASFKGASEVVWNQTQNAYEVKFKHNEIQTRVTYDTEGSIVKTMRYYQEEQLPMLIRAKITQRYAGKKIFGVTELSADDELNYYVILEDAKHWTTIKCDSYGNTSIYKKMKKA